MTSYRYLHVYPDILHGSSTSLILIIYWYMQLGILACAKYDHDHIDLACMHIPKFRAIAIDCLYL